MHTKAPLKTQGRFQLHKVSSLKLLNLTSISFKSNQLSVQPSNPEFKMKVSPPYLRLLMSNGSLEVPDHKTINGIEIGWLDQKKSKLKALLQWLRARRKKNRVSVCFRRKEDEEREGKISIYSFLQFSMQNDQFTFTNQSNSFLVLSSLPRHLT